ncbi:hypothetical protein [Actinomadura yumaensis]|uniref:Uncharacterized protein n=1 Tax=Actinomadura yumaensis TaxID=111807 RepID=A0ABW2CNV9_9ACTN
MSVLANLIFAAAAAHDRDYPSTVIYLAVPVLVFGLAGVGALLDRRHAKTEAARKARVASITGDENHPKQESTDA